MEEIGFLNEINCFSDDWELLQESFCPASESTASHNSRLPSIHNTSYEFQSRQPFCIALTSFSDQTPVRTSGFTVNGTVEYRLIYAGQLSPVAKVDATGTVLETYVYGLGVNSPDYIIKNGTEYRVVKDHLGSMRMIVDSTTGTIVKSVTYDEFGNITNETGTFDTIFGYVGGIRDIDTGLTKFGARWYDPVTGRWIEKEPLGFNGSDNFYSYCDGDPINWVDFNGKFKFKPVNGKPFKKVYKKAYERITSLYKRLNKKKYDAFKKYGQADKEAVNAAMCMDSGVTIRVGKVDGGYGELDPITNEIVLDAAMLDQYDLDTIRDIFLDALVEHELVHYFDSLDGIDHPLEEGEEYEKAVYGERQFAIGGKI